MQTLADIFKEKEAQRFKLKVGVFAIIRQQDSILLLRRFQTGTEDGMYVVPMGGHDGNEPLSQSLIREAKEEVNIDCKEEDLSVCHVMHRLHHMPNNLSFEQIDIFFQINNYEGVIKNNEPDKCDDLRFFPLTDLPHNVSPFIKKALHCVQNGQFYSEFGWE